MRKRVIEDGGGGDAVHVVVAVDDDLLGAAGESRILAAAVSRSGISDGIMEVGSLGSRKTAAVTGSARFRAASTRATERGNAHGRGDGLTGGGGARRCRSGGRSSVR